MRVTIWGGTVRQFRIYARLIRLATIKPTPVIKSSNGDGSGTGVIGGL